MDGSNAGLGPKCTNVRPEGRSDVTEEGSEAMAKVPRSVIGPRGKTWPADVLDCGAAVSRNEVTTPFFSSPVPTVNGSGVTKRGYDAKERV